MPCRVRHTLRIRGKKCTSYFLGDEVTFESIGLTVSVEDIYYRVDNDDVKSYLEEKSPKAE